MPEVGFSAAIPGASAPRLYVSARPLGSLAYWLRSSENAWPAVALADGIDDCTTGGRTAVTLIVNDPLAFADCPFDTLKSTVTGPACWSVGGVQEKRPDDGSRLAPDGGFAPRA